MGGEAKRGQLTKKLDEDLERRWDRLYAASIEISDRQTPPATETAQSSDTAPEKDVGGSALKGTIEIQASLF